MNLRRAAIGFVVRLAAATAISFAVWWLYATPFDRLPFGREATFAIVRVANFPVAAAGELLDPFRGAAVLFGPYDTWCDFCPYEQVRWLQLRIAIPTYLLLFYLPNAIRLFGRRRLAIALALCALPITACALATDGNVAVTFRFGGRLLLILAIAGAIACSHLMKAVKICALAAAFLASAWLWLPDLLPSFLTAGILWLTHAIDSRSISGTSFPYRTSP